ncbi:hypothetical protein [Streptomyces scabiei]|uniref:hypothetical protein n=1 Tax=Streptomyces TaxID=1883 RepID=UPI0029B4AF16|nr:hypothetical protein [Streptomyces scabiei]MDX3116934.1 hypothetical protein [Streptomyces scabiei]
MTWDEWEQLKAKSVGGQSAQMRLNQIPADPGGGSPGVQPDLASSSAEKRAAARAIEDHIEPDTRKAGDWADTDTNVVVKAFAAKDGEGWVTAGAVKQAHETWGEQVQTLMNRLSADKAALRGANTTLHGTDIATGTGMNSVSAADRY